MARALLVLVFLALAASLGASDLVLGGPKGPTAKGPSRPGTQGKQVAKRPRPVAKGTTVGGRKMPQAIAPGAKVTVTCQVSAQGTPYKVTTCNVLSKEKVPVCVRLSCTPNFQSPCNGSPCAWSVNRDCSSPWPLYPSAQSQWGFGYMSLQGGPPNVKVLSYRPAVGGVCPTV